MAAHLNPFFEANDEVENTVNDEDSELQDESNMVQNDIEKKEKSGSEISADNVATKLLKDNFVLTALEFHTELLEAGRELPRLKNFFSNPLNFEKPKLLGELSATNLHRTNSVQTFDSLDFARYSDDGDRQESEKVAVLEFELRQAQETIKSLREALTKSAESDLPGGDTDQASTEEIVNDSIRTYEIRALNFLVNEYLLKNNYKLTSVTFAEENEDQDFEDWDEVGLNIAKPPDLLHLYRDYGQHVGLPDSEKETTDRSCQASDEDQTYEAQLRDLESEHEDLVKKIEKLEEQILSLSSENSFLGNLIKEYERSGATIGRSSTPMVTPTGTPTKTRQARPDSREADETGPQASREEAGQGQEEADPELVQAAAGLRLLPEGESVNGDSSTEGDFIEDEICNDEIKPQLQQEGSQSEQKTHISEDNTLEKNESRCEDLLSSMQVEVSSVAPMSVDLQAQVSLSESSSLHENSTLLNNELYSLPDATVQNRKCPHSFLTQLLKLSLDAVNENRIVREMVEITQLSPAKVVYMLGRCLPHIVPNVLLAKREELIPAIMSTAILHPDAKYRDQLLNILFNLIKKPDKEQRQMILLGCVAFARRAGPGRTEAELLPQCWEQLGHKHPERRLLVAEACGALAPYLSGALRGSLVLSMLQQMLEEEKEEDVRAGVLHSLGLLTGLLEDHDKYQLMGDLLMKCLLDPSEKLSVVSQAVFLPAYAMWSLELDRLESQLIPRFVRKLQGLVKASAQNTLMDKAGFCLYVRCLQEVNPTLFSYILQNGPFTEKISCTQTHSDLVTRLPKPSSQLTDLSVILGSGEHAQELLSTYDACVCEEWYEPWAAYTWLLADYIPELISLMNELDPLQPQVVHTLVRYFNNLCRLLGRQMTVSKIKVKFQQVLSLPTNDTELNPENVCVALTKITTPVFAAGVLAAFREEADMNGLRNFIQVLLQTLALSQVSLASLRAVFTELCYEPIYHEFCLSILWDGVVHTSAMIRQAAAVLFEEVARSVDESLVSARIVPALVTLSSDPEISVRVATVGAFGTIAEIVTNRATLDKVYMQLQMFMDDPAYREHHLVVMELVKTFARVGPNVEPKFRDECILPRLAIFASTNNRQTNIVSKREMVHQLFEAYAKLACCFISDHLINESFLPGLRFLYQGIQEVAGDMVPVIESMIREFEEKLEAARIGERPSQPQTSEGVKNRMFGRFKDVTSRLGKK